MRSVLLDGSPSARPVHTLPRWNREGMMGGRVVLALLLWACGVVLEGCGDTASPGPAAGEEIGTVTWEEALGPAVPLEVAPALVLRNRSPSRPPPPAAPPSTFQPAFHQALRWSQDVSSLATFRLRIPVGRAGDRLRVTFRSGDGALTLQRATVGRAQAGGGLASAPVALTFSGAPGFTTGARSRVTSDPLPFPVRLRDELVVSFEVQGTLAASAINALPGGAVRAGAHAATPDALGGQPWDRAVGLATLDVEGPAGRAFVAVGDSITEGYVGTRSDVRNAWPALAGAQLGVPLVNAGVSGQGFDGAIEHLDQEVLALQGITDCLILLGTNDLGVDTFTDAYLQQQMTRLFDKLAPFCRLWVSTLLPKEKSSQGNYEAVKSGRLALNAWLRQQQRATVIDLEAVTRQPDNVHLFLDGLEVDGIHPSVEGHRVMAAEVARVLRPTLP